MSDVVGVSRHGEQLLAASLLAMAVLDDERQLSVNGQYADLFGFEDRAALEGAAWGDRFDEDSRARIEREALPLCRDTGQWRGEVTGRRLDGSSLPLELSLTRLNGETYASCLRQLDTGERSADGTTDHQRLETIVETVDDGIYVLDETLEFDFVNEAFCELAGRTREDLRGTSVTDLFTYEDEKAMAAEIRERVVEGDTSTGTVQATMPTDDGERTLEARYRLHPEPDGAFRGSIGIVRDVTEREERERRLQRQDDELETLDRVNELVLDVTRDLFESASRPAIEETVCEWLAASDLYRFCWIGEAGPGWDGIGPCAVAGIDPDYVETRLTPEGSDASGPAARAVRAGEPVVAQDIGEARGFEAWRPAAADHDVRSAAAVPLVTGEVTYGVLALYSTRPMAFSRREREGLETLGRAVGYAINAIENRKLLYADTVVELEFEVSDPGLVFVRASGRLGCELEIVGCVESESGTRSVYVTVDGADPGAVRDVATEAARVETVRVVAAGDHGGVLEFVMTPPAIDEFTEHGAVLTSGHVDDGTGRFCIEAPQATDVRRVRDRLLAAYPQSTLVAQREHERPARTAREVRQSLAERLTDRQREALERAAHAGYFEWPRTSTAGDVADSMGISETTFHYHLRNGLDTLLGVLTDLDGR